jgi:hypothetical protein
MIHPVILFGSSLHPAAFRRILAMTRRLVNAEETTEMDEWMAG